MKLLPALLLLTALPAHADSPSLPSLKKAFCPFQEKAAEAIFAPQIYHDASLEDFAGIFAQQRDYYGPCKGITKKGDEIRIEYRDAVLPLRGQFTKGKIRNFYFGRPSFPDDNFEKIKSFADRTLGKASLFVSKDGKKILEHNPAPLNIGTNHSVFILKALKEKTDRKELSAETVVRLDDKVKSGSAGFLHFWAAGTALTIDTLKNMMFVERDLSAADMLIQAVGKKEIEKGGARLTPFLTNREYAQLFAEKDAARIIKSPKRLADLFNQNKFIEYPPERYDLTEKIGWFASTGEICSTLHALKEEKMIFSRFREVTEEEGRERWSDYSLFTARGWGIAQNSALLRIKGKPSWYCVSITGNSHEAIEEQAIGDLTARIYSIIHAIEP